MALVSPFRLRLWVRNSSNVIAQRYAEDVTLEDSAATSRCPWCAGARGAHAVTARARAPALTLGDDRGILKANNRF